jgi:hypothetical protein
MAVLGGSLLSRYSLEKAANAAEPAVNNVNLNSSPSQSAQPSKLDAHTPDL